MCPGKDPVGRRQKTPMWQNITLICRLRFFTPSFTLIPFFLSISLCLSLSLIVSLSLSPPCLVSNFQFWMQNFESEAKKNLPLCSKSALLSLQKRDYHGKGRERERERASWETKGYELVRESTAFIIQPRCRASTSTSKIPTAKMSTKPLKCQHLSIKLFCPFLKYNILQRLISHWRCYRWLSLYLALCDRLGWDIQGKIRFGQVN
jgi:hypothetical protein